MFKIITTLVACALFGTSLTEIDGSYLHLTSFALGAFILGGVIALAD